jgi:hypothetical protein
MLSRQLLYRLGLETIPVGADPAVFPEEMFRDDDVGEIGEREFLPPDLVVLDPPFVHVDLAWTTALPIVNLSAEFPERRPSAPGFAQRRGL